MVSFRRVPSWFPTSFAHRKPRFASSLDGTKRSPQSTLEKGEDHHHNGPAAWSAMQGHRSTEYVAGRWAASNIPTSFFLSLSSGPLQRRRTRGFSLRLLGNCEGASDMKEEALLSNVSAECTNSQPPANWAASGYLVGSCLLRKIPASGAPTPDDAEGPPGRGYPAISLFLPGRGTIRNAFSTPAGRAGGAGGKPFRDRLEGFLGFKLL